MAGNTAYVGLVDESGAARVAVYLTVGTTRPAEIGSIALPAPAEGVDPPVIQRVLAAPVRYLFILTSTGELFVADCGGGGAPARPLPAIVASARWRPARPLTERQRWLAANEWVADAALVGDAIHVLDRLDQRLVTIDVSDPAAPRVAATRPLATGEILVAGGSSRLVTTGACDSGFHHCLDSTSATLRAYSADRAGARPAGAYESFAPRDVAVAGTAAYVAAGARRVLTFDLTDAAHPRLSGTMGPERALEVLPLGDLWLIAGSADRAGGPVTELWRLDRTGRAGKGERILTATDLGASSLDLLAAGDRHFLVHALQQWADARDGINERQGDVVAVELGADGQVAGRVTLDGLNNPLAAAVMGSYAHVLADRYYPPPAGFDPATGGGYSVEITGNDLLTYELSGAGPLTPRSSVEVSGAQESMAVDAPSARLYLWQSSNETLVVADVSAPAAPTLSQHRIANRTRDDTASRLRQLDPAGRLAFAVGGHSRSVLLDLGNPARPAAVAVTPAVWASAARTVSDRHGLAYGTGAGLFALEVRRGWLR